VGLFYDRGYIGSFERIVHIDLSHNKIWKFTNKMGLQRFNHYVPMGFHMHIFVWRITTYTTLSIFLEDEN